MPYIKNESEEMYLITIAHLAMSSGQDCVSMTRLAQEMKILPVSAIQMVRKLEKSGLATYLPYKGVLLTAGGQGRAGQVMRQRRLWEAFLVQKLQFSADEAARLACRLEHVTSAELADRLARYLQDEGKSAPPASISPGEKVQPADLGEVLSDLK